MGSLTCIHPIAVEPGALERTPSDAVVKARNLFLHKIARSEAMGRPLQSSWTAAVDKPPFTLTDEFICRRSRPVSGRPGG